MKGLIDSHIDYCKELLTQKEYLLALDELKCAVLILEKIVEQDKEYPYLDTLKQLVIYRQSAMNGIIKEAGI